MNIEGENTMNSVGQYTMVSRDKCVKFGDRSFRVVLYGAYNAMGLIGTENNGIAVLDEDRMQVVLDGHYPEESGAFGATEFQACEWRRICLLSAEEFVEFCNSHPNSRDPISLESKVNRKPRFSASRFIDIAEEPVAYNEPAKREFLRLGKQMAIRLASALGLNEDQYEVRVNKGGIAVSGEVTLHTDTHYVQFGQFPGAEGFLARACNGRKDYTGGRNYYIQWGNLRNLEGVAEFILSLT
jgi:hypothetical protein